MLTADDVWCQLFSEPEAGSDLASLTTKAAPVEGGWVLNGAKLWTSYASYADWGICLARTDPDAPRHRGLSMLAVEMQAPGIEIRPLRTITGETDFNEVFLTDVFVPTDAVVGGLGAGWAVANTTLAHERGTSFPFREQAVYESWLDELWRVAVDEAPPRRPRRVHGPRRCIRRDARCCGCTTTGRCRASRGGDPGRSRASSSRPGRP